MKATIIILIALICFASAVFDYPAARQKLIDLRETHDHYENVLQDRALTESTLSPGPPYGKPISYLFLPVFAGGYNVSEAGEFYEQFIFGAPYTPGDSYRVRYEVADVTGFDNSTGQELVNGTVVIWMFANVTFPAGVRRNSLIPGWTNTANKTINFDFIFFTTFENNLITDEYFKYNPWPIIWRLDIPKPVCYWRNYFRFNGILSNARRLYEVTKYTWNSIFREAQRPVRKTDTIPDYDPENDCFNDD